MSDPVTLIVPTLSVPLTGSTSYSDELQLMAALDFVVQHFDRNGLEINDQAIARATAWLAGKHGGSAA